MNKIIKTIAGVSKHKVTSSVLKIFDIAVSAGIASTGAVLPGAVYEFSKMGAGKIRDYIHSRDDRRINEFHKKLLCPDGVLDEGILAGEIEEANYHALLNACLSDIEDEKTELYAKLTRTIAAKGINGKLYRHFILSLKDISWDDFDYLRQVYVISENSIIASRNGGTVSADSFIGDIPQAGVHGLPATTLKTKGFLEGKNITYVGSQFVKACSPEDDLAPGAYGFRVWSKHHCRVYMLDQSIQGIAALKSIKDSLDEKGIGNIGASVEESLLTPNIDSTVTCAIIIYKAGKKLEAPALENLKHQLCNKIFIQVVLGDDSPVLDENLLPGDFVKISDPESVIGARAAIEKLITELNKQH